MLRRISTDATVASLAVVSSPMSLTTATPQRSAPSGQTSSRDPSRYRTVNFTRSSSRRLRDVAYRIRSENARSQNVTAVANVVQNAGSVIADAAARDARDSRPRPPTPAARHATASRPDASHRRPAAGPTRTATVAASRSSRHPHHELRVHRPRPPEHILDLPRHHAPPPPRPAPPPRQQHLDHDRPLVTPPRRHRRPGAAPRDLLRPRAHVARRPLLPRRLHRAQDQRRVRLIRRPRDPEPLVEPLPVLHRHLLVRLHATHCSAT